MATEPRRLVRRVAGQVRRRRVEHYALRGFFWASLPAVVLLAFKGPLGARALPLAGGLLVAGPLARRALGRAQADDAVRTPRGSPTAPSGSRIAWRRRSSGRSGPTARRSSTRWSPTPSRASRRWTPRQIVARILPREARFLPVPLVVALVLALAPALPLPVAAAARLLAVGPGGGDGDRARAPARSRSARSAQAARAAAATRRSRSATSPPRAAAPAPATSGDLSAIFKDTALSVAAPRLPELSSRRATSA